MNDPELSTTSSGRTWPRWAPAAVVLLGAVSLPLVVFQPLAAVLTAAGAMIAGTLGARSHHGRDRQLYLTGAALGVVTWLLLALAALGLFTASQTSPQAPSPPQPVPSPPVSSPAG
ncbi:hypothetical protein GCM10009676_30190 [Prauserella halophila]|uniref:DUF4190 domain-containing protein n=1 Tax=Prauserella halophila TaxID=185641 RepID=A0ABN1WB09_9PSEU|nr:hypothetical protein [Prauserella halophila]MCP2237073.1 hypothetical protein [Prauserella halophila]